MANLANRFLENVKGRFFVDNQCIDCDLCRQIAPDFFKRSFSGAASHSVVYRQPSNSREESLCRSAMESCPVEAIGSIHDDVDVLVGRKSYQSVPQPVALA
ncbi:MAG: ferredoxin [Verrucomicrobiota bacterium]|nr:ferredoxin [Verrucomicrobiota bacterium]